MVVQVHDSCTQENADHDSKTSNSDQNGSDQNDVSPKIEKVSNNSEPKSIFDLAQMTPYTTVAQDDQITTGNDCTVQTIDHLDVINTEEPVKTEQIHDPDIIVISDGEVSADEENMVKLVEPTITGSLVIIISSDEEIDDQNATFPVSKSESDTDSDDQPARPTKFRSKRAYIFNSDTESDRSVNLKTSKSSFIIESDRSSSEDPDEDDEDFVNEADQWESIDSGNHMALFQAKSAADDAEYFSK